MNKNTDYIKANAFAFYSINGSNLIDFMGSSKQKMYVNSWKKLWNKIQGRRIILVLDNSRSHHADKTVKKARELKITLVFLPPYSPDLNPVEFIWKTIKREVSVKFIQSKEHLGYYQE